MQDRAVERDRAGVGGPWYAVTVMATPVLHLLKLSGLTPKERVLALARLMEQITGRKPAPEELEKALQKARATEPAAKGPDDPAALRDGR